MKYLPFKVLILCILLPPLLYIVSIQTIERYFKARCTRDIESIYIGDTRPLFNGSLRLEEAITKNIDRYLQSKVIFSLGFQGNVQVTAKPNVILYPGAYPDIEDLSSPPDPGTIAAENFKLMSDGLSVSVDIYLDHNTLLSNALLVFYLMISVGFFYLYYRHGLNQALSEDKAKASQIVHLREQERRSAERLQELGEQRRALLTDIDQVKAAVQSEKSKASRNEEEMIEEMVALENRLEENLAFQEAQRVEIKDLKEKIQDLQEAVRKEGKPKNKALEIVGKRFDTLYKRIYIHQRAVSGYMNLTEDMKIKAEEVIHQLNQDPDQVPIKRKVFGKKNRETSFEVMFAYNGRLYFRTRKGSKVEVLAIGTKNTQNKDLKFLDNL